MWFKMLLSGSKGGLYHIYIYTWICCFVCRISQRYCVVCLIHIQDITLHYDKLSTTDLGGSVPHIYIYIFQWDCFVESSNLMLR